MKLIIRNGKIITADNIFSGNIIAENGKISNIYTADQGDQYAGNEINAENMLIFPGGIDPHVHLYLPTPAGYSADDFYSGSKAALYSGTTTVVDFVTPKRGQSIVEALHLRKEEAKNSLVDYKFHVSPVEWTSNTKNEILHCIKNEGVSSFKVYMAYKNNIGLDDADILKVMEVVGNAGGLVTVHAEMGDDIESLRNQFVTEGKIDPEFHALSRPATMEAAAVKKVIKMAEKAGCPVYIVHVSCKKSIDYIRKAQENGQVVYAETCPHYLLLDDSKYKGDFNKVSPYVMSPPLRKKADQEALWQAIKDGVIQTIGTDHCPFNLNQKKYGLHDFRKIPNGVGGIEHRLALLYTFGVLQHKITLNQFVDLCATQAAKIFGLYPQKGAILPGADADLLIWNPSIKKSISYKTHHMNCDNNIYEGFETMGAPEYVIRMGCIVYNRQNDSLITDQTGRFIK